MKYNLRSFGKHSFQTLKKPRSVACNNSCILVFSYLLYLRREILYYTLYHISIWNLNNSLRFCLNSNCLKADTISRIIMMKKFALVSSVLKFKLKSRGIRESDHLSVCILLNLNYSMR